MERIELSTSSLPRKRSTPELHWRGAEDEVRTRDPQLGRLMLYQLSYFRVFSAKNRGFVGCASAKKQVSLHSACTTTPLVVAYFKGKARSWGFTTSWARMDSNHRRHRQQIYSLSHLTALVLAHFL